MNGSGFERERLKRAEAGFVHRTSARFQDVDAAGIVFFARVFDYFHDAYAAFLAEGGLPLPEILRARAWAAPLRRAEADYLSPIRFGDPLEVALVHADWEASTLSVGYRVSTPGSKTAAVGVTQHVIVDVASFSRIEPPEPLRALFLRLARGPSA
jgi:YbgC/YbaW family acyl-CoA thioester hydrolase